MPDQPTTVDMNERSRRRRASFDAEFTDTAERALIAIHTMVHDELDLNPDPEWSAYHVGTAARLVEELQRRYEAWENAFLDAEADGGHLPSSERARVARVRTEAERAEEHRRHDAARRDLYPEPVVPS